MFEWMYPPSKTPQTKALVDEVAAASRSEAQAASRRLAAIGQLMAIREREYEDRGG